MKSVWNHVKTQGRAIFRPSANRTLIKSTIDAISSLTGPQFAHLCRKCANLKFELPESPRERYQTHSDSIADLEFSATAGCHLCTLIFSSLALLNHPAHVDSESANSLSKAFFRVKVVFQVERTGLCTFHISADDFGSSVLLISTPTSPVPDTPAPIRNERRRQTMQAISAYPYSPNCPCIQARLSTSQDQADLKTGKELPPDTWQKHVASDGLSFCCISYNAGQVSERLFIGTEIVLMTIGVQYPRRKWRHVASTDLQWARAIWWCCWAHER